MSEWDAFLLNPADDVAVVLRPVAAGHAVRVRGGHSVTARTDIPMAHKLALHDIAARAPVRKYGEIIGEARAAIAAGDHVHVHNIVSRRARRPA
jgi:altronate dehydratase